VPSQILHALFGEDLLAALDRSLCCRPVEEACLPAFILGCQGPDIFYHSQFTLPVGLEYGTLLHRRSYGSFTAALFGLALPKDVPKHPGDLAAYVWGFVTHAILDRACHPYIVYKTAKPDKEGRGRERNLHAFFERILDTLMLEELRNMPAAAWDQESLARICDNPPPGLRELLAEALRQVFPERAGRDGKLSRRIDNALRDSAFFYHHTDPGKTSFHHPTQPEQSALQRRILEKPPLTCLYPEDLPRDIDYLNREHRPWHYPLVDGEQDTRSFPEIYAQALEAAVETLGPLAAEYREKGFLSGGETIARRIGNGGLSIQARDGKPCPATRSDPLPLERVLEQQRQARLAIPYPA
jgi:hypothetical protein